MEDNKIKLKIIYLGTPEFGAVVLEGLIKNNYKPILAITAPDKPAGRKQILTPPPVKTLAQKHKILVLQPTRIGSRLSGINPDLGIVSAYGQIIPKDILKIPKYGFINVHPSLLPKYRGPSPIQTAILNGDQKTGVTIILMDEKIDHGKIISNFQFPISNKKITYQKLSQKLAELGAELLIKTIPKWINNEIKPQPQDESKATYTKIIKKEDGKIDWSKPAEKIERQIRAFYPWPGSFTFFKKNGKILRVKILEAEISKEEKPKQLCIKCGKNYLAIKKLQPENKKPMTAEDFKRGYGNAILF
jgi:methionyl-tRNA formyltransferase